MRDLSKKESQKFNLRLWMDENVENEDSMNATYEGKITITSTYKKVTLLDEEVLSVIKNQNQVIYDGTKDDNLRFIGADPNNYVTFNNETWRIIGVMNNIEDEYGNVGSHIKIIRDSIGEYSWDSSLTTINGGLGINEWSKADIKEVLNNNYYLKERGGICYNARGNSTTLCPLWENIGLDSDARSKISKVKWNTGTIKEDFGINSEKTTPPEIYESERSNNNGKICTKDTSYCSDEINRTTEWIDFVGLMYPSDYGFATSGGGESQRQNCLNTRITSWNSGNFKTNCALNSWLYDSKQNQWTLTPTPYSPYAYGVLFLDLNGHVHNSDASAAHVIRPVVYLNSNIKIEGDDASDYGSITNPYKLIK